MKRSSARAANVVERLVSSVGSRAPIAAISAWIAVVSVSAAAPAGMRMASGWLAKTAASDVTSAATDPASGAGVARLPRIGRPELAQVRRELRYPSVRGDVGRGRSLQGGGEPSQLVRDRQAASQL